MGVGGGVVFGVRGSVFCFVLGVCVLSVFCFGGFLELVLFRLFCFFLSCFVLMGFLSLFCFGGYLECLSFGLLFFFLSLN